MPSLSCHRLVIILLSISYLCPYQSLSTLSSYNTTEDKLASLYIWQGFMLYYCLVKSISKLDVLFYQQDYENRSFNNENMIFFKLEFLAV